jgi:hypothetical protein
MMMYDGRVTDVNLLIISTTHVAYSAAAISVPIEEMPCSRTIMTPNKKGMKSLIQILKYVSLKSPEVSPDFY